MTYRDPPPVSPIIVCATGAHVFGLDRASGARVWQHTFDGRGDVQRLAFLDDHVFVGLTAGLACVVLRTGVVVWEKRVAVSTSTMLFDRDRIVVGATGQVACYDLSGKLLWEDELKGFGIAPVALGVPGNVANVDNG